MSGLIQPIDLQSARPYAMIEFGKSKHLDIKKCIVKGHIGVLSSIDLSQKKLRTLCLHNNVNIDNLPAKTAYNDFLKAFNDAKSRQPTTFLDVRDFKKKVHIIPPGVHRVTSDLKLEGDVFLNGLGNSNSVWIFQIQGKLSTDKKTIIKLIHQAKAEHVFWQVDDSVSIEKGTEFMGTILSQKSINVEENVSTHGGLFSALGDVSIHQCHIRSNSKSRHLIGIDLTRDISQVFDKINFAIEHNIQVIFVNHNKFKDAFFDLLKNLHIISDMEETPFGQLKITLRYDGSESFIKKIHIISHPEKRVYVTVEKLRAMLPEIAATSLITTSNGVFTIEQAINLGVGGQLICKIKTLS